MKSGGPFVELIGRGWRDLRACWHGGSRRPRPGPAPGPVSPARRVCWIRRIATEPSPTAAATRLADPWPVPGRVGSPAASVSWALVGLARTRPSKKIDALDHQAVGDAPPGTTSA